MLVAAGIAQPCPYVLIGHLSRDKGLLLLHGGGRLFLSNLDVLLRGSREVRLVHSGGSGRGGRGGARGLATAEHFLCLGSVITHELLGHLGSVSSVGAGQTLELRGLGVDNFLRILKVVVDQLLVGGVDQGHGEQEGGGDECKTPVWDNLNKPVGEESANRNLGEHEKESATIPSPRPEARISGWLGMSLP